MPVADCHKEKERRIVKLYLILNRCCLYQVHPFDNGGIEYYSGLDFAKGGFAMGHLDRLWSPLYWLSGIVFSKRNSHTPRDMKLNTLV